MKRKQRMHLRGQRGQAFADQIRGVQPERILCVSIDVSKDFHVVLLHNGLGEIVTPSFEIDSFVLGSRNTARQWTTPSPRCRHKWCWWAWSQQATITKIWLATSIPRDSR